MSRRQFIISLGILAAHCLVLSAGAYAQVSPPSVLKATGNTDQSERLETIKRPLYRPVIGITSLTSDTYVRAVRQCGGIPVVLPNTDGAPESVDEYLEMLDGLLMPGGADIPPSEYGEAPHQTANLLGNDRYLFEKAIIKAWIERTDKPLLGICLGSQWVNVAHGGSLIQDIPSEFGGHPRNVSHMVMLEPDSRLCRIFGQTEFEVNSLHHQAVRVAGKGLRVVARSPDGIIEATESIDPDRFIIGVQWHPEKLMPENKLQAKLIQAFIDASINSKE